MKSRLPEQGMFLDINVADKAFANKRVIDLESESRDNQTTTGIKYQKRQP